MPLPDAHVDRSPWADDRAWAAAICAGDRAASEQLVRAYAPRLLGVARRLLGREEDAQDALQDAFSAAFQALPRYEGQARLSTWLHRITVNAALMRLRSRGRRPEVAIEDLLPRFLDDGHNADPARPWSSASDDPLVQAQEAALVRRCVAQLPEAYRVVLTLRDLEELDTDETAALLQTTPGNVKVRLHRARQALRALLDPHLRPGAP